MANPIKIFKTLQKHVADVNEIVAGLYNEQIDADAAVAKASGIIEKPLKVIREL